MHWQPRKPTVSRSVSKEVCPAGCDFYLHSGEVPPPAASSSRSTRIKIWNCWNRSGGGWQGWAGDWSTSAVKKGWESWDYSAQRLWGDLTAAFPYLKGAYMKNGDGLFTRSVVTGQKAKSFKLKNGKFRLDIRKKLFYSDGEMLEQQVIQRSCGCSITETV